MKIPSWAAEGIKFAISTLRSLLVPQIEPESLAKVVGKFTNRLSDTVTVLADDNPKDGEQLKAIWLDFIGTEAADFLQAESPTLLSKIENPKARAIAQATTPFAINVLRIYTDSNPENLKQLRANLKALLQNDSVWDVVIPD